jgi:hypothetical protein
VPGEYSRGKSAAQSSGQLQVRSGQESAKDVYESEAHTRKAHTRLPSCSLSPLHLTLNRLAPLRSAPQNLDSYGRNSPIRDMPPEDLSQQPYRGSRSGLAGEDLAAIPPRIQGAQSPRVSFGGGQAVVVPTSAGSPGSRSPTEEQSLLMSGRQGSPSRLGARRGALFSDEAQAGE